MDTVNGTKKGKIEKNYRFTVTGEFKYKCKSILDEHMIPLAIYTDYQLDNGISEDTIKNLVYPIIDIEKEKKKPTYYRHDHKTLNKFIEALNSYRENNKSQIKNIDKLKTDIKDLKKELEILSELQYIYPFMYDLQHDINFFDRIYDIELFMLDFFFDTYAMIDETVWDFCMWLFLSNDRQQIISKMHDIISRQEAPADILSMKPITSFMSMALKSEDELKELYIQECFKSKKPVRKIEWTKEMPKSERRSRNKSIEEKIKNYDEKHSANFKKASRQFSIHLRNDFWKAIVLYKIISLSNESEGQLNQYLEKCDFFKSDTLSKIIGNNTILLGI